MLANTLIPTSSTPCIRNKRDDRDSKYKDTWQKRPFTVALLVFVLLNTQTVSYRQHTDRPKNGLEISLVDRLTWGCLGIAPPKIPEISRNFPSKGFSGNLLSALPDPQPDLSFFTVRGVLVGASILFLWYFTLFNNHYFQTKRYYTALLSTGGNKQSGPRGTRMRRQTQSNNNVSQNKRRGRGYAGIVVRPSDSWFNLISFCFH